MLTNRLKPYSEIAVAATVVVGDHAEAFFAHTGQVARGLACGVKQRQYQCVVVIDIVHYGVEEHWGAVVVAECAHCHSVQCVVHYLIGREYGFALHEMVVAHHTLEAFYTVGVVGV